MSEAQKLECAKEAIAAHGSRDKIIDWYKKWRPEYYEEYGLPAGGVEYSCSCFLMEHSLKIIEQ